MAVWVAFWGCLETPPVQFAWGPLLTPLRACPVHTFPIRLGLWLHTYIKEAVGSMRGMHILQPPPTTTTINMTRGIQGQRQHFALLGFVHYQSAQHVPGQLLKPIMASVDNENSCSSRL